MPILTQGFNEVKNAHSLFCRGDVRSGRRRFRSNGRSDYRPSHGRQRRHVLGAIVTVTNPQTNVARSTTTNSAGDYTFPAMQPGVYNVKAEMRGFKGEVREGVVLEVEQIARIDFHLQVGAIT